MLSAMLSREEDSGGRLRPVGAMWPPHTERLSREVPETPEHWGLVRPKGHLYPYLSPGAGLSDLVCQAEDVAGLW